MKFLQNVNKSVGASDAKTGHSMKFQNNGNFETESTENKLIHRPSRHRQRHSDVFIVNFKHISHLVLVFLLLTLSR